VIQETGQEWKDDEAMSILCLRAGGKQICGLLILTALNLWPHHGLAGDDRNTSSPKALRPVAQYQPEVYLGIGELHYPANVVNCVLFWASFSADGFFDGLTLTDTPTGPLFRKQGQPLRVFPDILLVEVTAALSLRPCDDPLKVIKDGSKLRIEMPGMTSEQLGPTPIDLGDSLRFEVALVEDLLTKPAEGVSTRVSKVPFTEGGPQEWDYKILVRTNGAPLTDHVKLSVLSHDGQFLTRMMGGLATPMSRRLYSTKKPKR
jgi:hypothetical protein